MSGRNWIAAAAFALAIAPRLAAAEYWSYETETGGVAFTDDAKSIPAKYQASAKPIKEKSLFEYDRLSIVDPVAASTPTHAGVAPKDAAVPVFAWPVPQPVAAVSPAGSSSHVSVNVGGMQIAVDGAGDEDEPLYVDRSQYQDLNGDYIDHNGIMSPTTIIRRGDKPIAYIDER